MSDPSFEFTQLSEPSKYATLTFPGTFDANIAYLLGQCCSKTYQQYAQYPAALDKNGSFDGGWSYEMLGDPIMTAESISVGAIVNQSGYYRNMPAGFAMLCTSSKYPHGITVIALRGTSSYDEGIKDIEAFPAQFLVGTNAGAGYEVGHLYGYTTPAGSVHGGFLNVYTQGENGDLPIGTDNGKGVFNTYYDFSRVNGSISKSINDLITQGSINPGIPLYITGHSLGAALAILCATDIAINFPSMASNLNMYNLAGPRVAAGLLVDGYTVFGPASKLVDFYDQNIPNSYRIVNAADIIPIATPTALNIGPAEVQFAHVAPSNQISFCAQTGSIGGNHSCDNVYVPYLKYLAENQNS